jgi:cell division protein ZapA
MNGGSNLSQPEKTRTTVDIYGQQYSIVGTESTSHVRLVASLVDDKMREISAKNPYLDINKIAVLTAVNTVNDYLKLKEKIEELEKQVKNEKD